MISTVTIPIAAEWVEKPQIWIASAAGVDIMAVGESSEKVLELVADRVREIVEAETHENATLALDQVSVRAVATLRLAHPIDPRKILPMAGIRVSKDGDQWCALVGPDLQEGVAGFGRTPAEAVIELERRHPEVMSE